MPESPTAAATREFVVAVPELAETLAEHVRDNDEVLAHVFFGDVARYAAAVAEARDEPRAERLGSALEPMATSRVPDVVNVIDVSFIEWFVWGDDTERAALEWLSQFWGPAMVARIQDFRTRSAAAQFRWPANGRDLIT